MVPASSLKSQSAPCGRIVDGEHYQDEDEETLLTDAVYYSVALRLVSAVMAFVFIVSFPRSGLSQVNSLLFGTWKLNLAKSVYQLGPPPTAQTQTYEPSGGGMKVSVETIAGNGARITYGYVAELDGKPYVMHGELTPNGAETIAIHSIDAFRSEAILRRGGEVVLTIRSVISQDGKTLTLTSRGTNLREQPTNSVTVFDK